MDEVTRSLYRRKEIESEVAAYENIDKFKDDIKTLRFGLIDGKPIPCIEITNIFGGFNCRNCAFYKEPFDNNYINCEKLRLDWLATAGQVKQDNFL